MFLAFPIVLFLFVFKIEGTHEVEWEGIGKDHERIRKGKNSAVYIFFFNFDGEIFL